MNSDSTDDFHKQMEALAGLLKRQTTVMAASIKGLRDRIETLEVANEAMRRLLVESGVLKADAYEKAKVRTQVESEQLDAEIRERIENGEFDDEEL